MHREFDVLLCVLIEQCNGNRAKEQRAKKVAELQIEALKKWRSDRIKHREPRIKIGKSEQFKEWYALYPNKSSGPEDAWKAWQQLEPSAELAASVIAVLVEQIDEYNAKKSAGLWCPEWKLPATWIRKRCFEGTVEFNPVPKNGGNPNQCPKCGVLWRVHLARPYKGKETCSALIPKCRKCPHEEHEPELCGFCKLIAKHNGKPFGCARA